MAFPLPLRRASDPLFVAVDAISALLAAAVGFYLRFGDTPVNRDALDQYRWVSLSLVVVWVVMARADGLYRRASVRPGVSNLEEATLAALMCAAYLALLNLLWPGLDVSYRWIGLTAAALVLVGCGSRILLRRLRRVFVPLGLFRERYAILGDDAQGYRLYRDLTRGRGQPFQVVSVFSMGISAEELLSEARALNIDGIIVPEGRLSRDQFGVVAARLAGAGVDLLLAPGLGDLDLHMSSFASLYGVPLLRSTGLAPRRRAVRMPPRYRKRGGIAILGSRGVPAQHGSYESLAEHLSTYLTDKGVPVTVYGRRGSSATKSWRGVRIVTPPTVRGPEWFASFVHVLLSTGHLLFATRVRDIVLCDPAHGAVLVPLRLLGRRTTVVMHSLEWRRSRLGVLARAWSRGGEWLTVRLASVLVTPTQEVRTYFRVRHDTDAVVIPPGADLLARGQVGPPTEMSLAPDGYVLGVGALVAENNSLLVAEAHAKSGVQLGLILVGVAEDPALVAAVLRAATEGTLLPGPVHGTAYRGLLANARCYVHSAEVGASDAGLVEALGAGNLCLVLDTQENRAVGGDSVRYFTDAEELADLLRWAAKLGAGELSAWRDAAAQRAALEYGWQLVGARFQGLLTPMA